MIPCEFCQNIQNGFVIELLQNFLIIDHCKKSLEKILLERNFALEKYARCTIIHKTQIQSLWKISRNLLKLRFVQKYIANQGKKATFNCHKGVFL